MRALPALCLLLAAWPAQARDTHLSFEQVVAQAAMPQTAEKKPAPSEKRPETKTFNAEQFTLANGMEVVVIPNHRAPVVTHMIWYKVGAADEKPGLSGMAHYFEHLMFKGTRDMAPGAYSKRIRTMGGNDNAFTGQDFTAYYATISVDRLGDVMRMEADRMQNLNPPDEHFASEKAVVLEERRERTDNDPRARFMEQLQSMVYTNHPYAKPVIGWMDEIQLYEWADVKTFYDAWYAPNNAILIVSGDITASELKPLAEDIYGSIPAKELPPRNRPRVPPANGTAALALRDAEIREPIWQSVYLAPSYHQNTKDSLALEVLQEVLSGGPTTRLYDSLVVKQKKAISIALSYGGTALDYGSLTLSGVPAKDVTPQTLQKLAEAEIRAVIKDGITQDELSEAIARLQDQAVYMRDSVSGPAMIVGYALTTGLTLDQVESWADDIAKVTLEDVQHVAKTYLDPAHPWIRPAVHGYMMPLDSKDEK